MPHALWRWTYLSLGLMLTDFAGITVGSGKRQQRVIRSKRFSSYRLVQSNATGLSSLTKAFSGNIAEIVASYKAFRETESRGKLGMKPEPETLRGLSETRGQCTHDSLNVIIGLFSIASCPLYYCSSPVTLFSRVVNLVNFANSLSSQSCDSKY